MALHQIDVIWSVWGESDTQNLVSTWQSLAEIQPSDSVWHHDIKFVDTLNDNSSIKMKSFLSAWSDDDLSRIC